MSHAPRIDAFLVFLDSLSEAQRDDFAHQVSRERYGSTPAGRETTYPYLRLIALGHAKASAPLARAIEIVTPRFGAPVPKAIFRPDIFGPPPAGSSESHP